jgi:hypothetical protein
MEQFNQIFRKYPYISLLINSKTFRIDHVNDMFDKQLMDRKLATNLCFADDLIQTVDKANFIAIIDDFKSCIDNDVTEAIFKTLTKPNINQRLLILLFNYYVLFFLSTPFNLKKFLSL